MDTDHNGSLNKQEFINFMTGVDHFDKNYKFMIPCSDYAWDLVWKKVDADGNGTCSFAEFLPLCLNMEEIVTKESMNEMFRLYDTNADGYVSKQELKAIIDNKRIC